jgi:hypothetical protein
MLKIALLVLLVALIVGNGGRRLRELFSTAKKLPDDFNKARARAEDPVGAAKEIKGRVEDSADR